MTPPMRASLAGLWPGRRRADELAAALDGALPAGAGAELRSLVGVASALRSMEPVQPRPEHTTQLRARLMAQAETLLSPEVQKLRVPPRPKGARERRLVAAAAAVVLIGGTASVATAAQTALPGQALYPIKRGIERAQAEIASTPAGKGHTLLAQAGDRLTEISGLLRQPPANADEVSSTLADFDTEARDGARLLLSSYRTAGDKSTVSDVRVFAAESLHRLAKLAPDSPDSSRPDFHRAAVLLRNLDAQASGLCATCAGQLPALKLPKLLLTHAEVEQGQVGNALHRASSTTLNNSHPVVVPRKSTGSSQGTSAAPSQAGSQPPPGSSGPASPQSTPAPDQQGTPAPGGVLPNPLPTTTPSPPADGGLQGTLQGTLNGTLNGTVNGLGGAVSTLLPNLGSSSGDSGSPDQLLP